MPSSRPDAIPTVIHLLRQLKPASILDVGVGFGKWGHLFREYTDIIAAEHDPRRYQRKNWRVIIDGIEGHAAYLTPMHRFLYNRIYRGDAFDLMRAVPRYDLIFLGDIIEHFDQDRGLKFLQRCLRKATRAVVLTTPKHETMQSALCANELERHRSLWSAKDFQTFPGAITQMIKPDILLAVLPRPGLPPLDLAPPRPRKSSVARRLALARDALVRNFGVTERFILVDEEQMRSQLPHRHALPFLEKNGLYWGPPADDDTAIAELERLRGTGATAIAIAWPCFWWLAHYQKFRDFLQSNFSCRLKSRALAIWDL